MQGSDEDDFQMPVVLADHPLVRLMIKHTHEKLKYLFKIHFVLASVHLKTFQNNPHVILHILKLMLTPCRMFTTGSNFELYLVMIVSAMMNDG